MIRHVTFGYISSPDELLLRYGIHKVIRTHAQTHSRTDTSEHTIPRAPKVFGGVGSL